jgi:hypothetical protein
MGLISLEKKSKGFLIREILIRHSMAAYEPGLGKVGILKNLYPEMNLN